MAIPVGGWGSKLGASIEDIQQFFLVIFEQKMVKKKARKIHFVTIIATDCVFGHITIEMHNENSQKFLSTGTD